MVIGREVIGFTVSAVGTLLIGISAINVHRRIAREHRIDRKVLRSVQREQVIAALGVILVILGYFLELPFKQ